MPIGSCRQGSPPGLNQACELGGSAGAARAVPSVGVSVRHNGAVSSELAAAVERWLSDDPDEATRAELSALWHSDPDEVRCRFEQPMTFGTAGLRGPVEPGPHGMNRVSVQRAAAGLVAWLQANVDRTAERGVVIGGDARRGSDQFVSDTAALVAGAGIRALVLPAHQPTPLTGFAVRHFGAAAGVMVTASHNPPADNGYKVFLETGGQLLAPLDAEIAAEIDRVGPLATLARSDGDLIEYVDESIIETYLDAQDQWSFVPEARDVTIATTALHGVGGALLMQALSRWGFTRVHAVAEQQEPDPAFPTVSFPNPEEPGAMDLLMALASSVDADVALANDPDADRLGVAIPANDGSWRRLRGDEIGWLLADYVLRHTTGDDRLVVTTVVSSTLLGKMAAARGVHYAETLTGFKYIGDAIEQHPELRFVFGYEQALGYLVGDVERDKDGISAACVFAELVADLKARGLTVHDRLDALAAEFGRHVTTEHSLRLDRDGQLEALGRLRSAVLDQLDGVAVVDVEERPDANLTIVRLDGGHRVMARPSGTEPKLKVYAEGIDRDPAGLLGAMVAILTGPAQS
jgi:phosphomannomutase